MFCAYTGISSHGKLLLDAQAVISRERKMPLGRKAGVSCEGKLLLDAKVVFSYGSKLFLSPKFPPTYNLISMQLQGYHTSTTRRRLSGQLTQHGTRMGISTTTAVFMGSLFIVFGSFIVLVGSKVIPVDPATVHAPYWALTIVGLSFSCGGLAVFTMGWRQYRAKKRREEALRHSSEPAVMADYPWDPTGFTPSRWKPAVSKTVAAVCMTVFLSVFNWWAFFDNGPIVVKVVVGLFDLVLIFVWYQAVLAVGRATKFGDSKIEFATFPYRRGQPVVLRWRPATAVVQIKTGTFVLRCVEEWFEQRGSGENRSVSLVHEELWSETWTAQASTLSRREEVELKFEPPAALPSTNLTCEKPIFWELQVKLDMPGFDFEQRYMVPVY